MNNSKHSPFFKPIMIYAVVSTVIGSPMLANNLEKEGDFAPISSMIGLGILGIVCCLLFAYIVDAIYFFVKKIEDSSQDKKDDNTWQCSNCKEFNSKSSRFCSSCGEKNNN